MEWIKKLKEGDDVVVVSYFMGKEKYVIHKVLKVTPTGIVKVSDGKSYNPETGAEKGKVKSLDYRDEIVEVTSESLNIARKQLLIKNIIGAWKKVDLELLSLGELELLEDALWICKNVKEAFPTSKDFYKAKSSKNVNGNRVYRIPEGYRDQKENIATIYDNINHSAELGQKYVFFFLRSSREEFVNPNWHLIAKYFEEEGFSVFLDEEAESISIDWED